MTFSNLILSSKSFCNDGNLNLARYIDNGETEEIVDVAAILVQLAALAEEEAEIDKRLNAYLVELGLLEVGV